jgi:hypothetical protein
MPEGIIARGASGGNLRALSHFWRRAMADPFATYQPGLTAPATDWFTITVGTSVLDVTPRAIDCLGAGNVDIESAAGTTITITLTPGAPYPCRPVKVKTPTTGSAATGIVGLV